MYKNLILVGAFLVSPIAGQAAIITSTATAFHEINGTIDGVDTTKFVDVGNAAPLLFGANTAAPSGQSAASVFLDYPSLSFDLSASAKNFGGTGAALHWGSAAFAQTQDYVVDGDGEVIISLSVSGLFNVLTDRDDGRMMNRVQASLSVAGDGVFTSDQISNFGPGDVLADANGMPFAESLSRTIAVNDGDVLRISIAGLAQAGDYPSLAEDREPLSSFFDAHSRIAGQFVIGGEGVALIPGDGSLSVVPLPAGLPLLLAGLGLFGAMQVRHFRRERSNL